jgi:pimeloyl-ACP methyl ester carboxylesterase
MTASWHERAGLRLSVSEAGEGRAFLFQHGLCGDAAQPAEVFPAGAGWRCLTLECRGHGRSPAGPPGELSIATFADDAASLLEARGAAPAVVGGISMGAAIALRLAVRRPDLVRALVLARPAWAWGAAPANMAPNALVGELLERLPPAEALARFEASETARRLAAQAPDNLASLRGFFSREPREVTSTLLRRISADGPGLSPGELAALRLPTLVLGTGRDLVHPLSLVAALAAAIPGARQVEIPSKAESRDRYREEFRAALARFLGELAP